MALKNGYGNVIKIRAYIDFVQYAKAVNYVEEIYNNSLDGDVGAGGNLFNPWDFNFSKVNTYTCNNDAAGWDASQNHLGFNIIFKDYPAGEYSNRLFAHFLQGINYYGLFGHELGIKSKFSHLDLEAYGKDSNGQQIFTQIPTADNVGIVGSRTSPGLGYTILGFDGFNQTDRHYFEALKVYLQSVSSTPWTPGDTINLGCISIGRYMDFPASTDLDVKLSYGYEGVKSTSTRDGSTITNINYYKRPDWGNFPSWFHLDKADLPDGVTNDWWKEFNIKQVGQNGRRVFNLKWSFLDKTDVFSKWSEHSQAANYQETNNWSLDALYDGTNHKETIVATLLNFTLGGQIPFIMQMDVGSGGEADPTNAQQSFALVKIDQKSVSIKQVAPGTYNVSLKLTEVW